MSVDVCFAIDVTGSMSGWIEACKAQVLAIATQLLPKIKQQTKGLDVRVRWGLEAYRDVDDAMPLEVVPFADAPDALISKVKSLQAAGGGDEPEDMAAALATAAALDWRSKARFLVVLADAPPHGSECHDLAAGADRYPGGSPTPGAGLAEVMEALRKNEIDLMMMPVKKGRLDKTLAAFRRHYERPDSTHLKLTVEPLFNAAAPPAGAFHFVFCLDCSGSMGGQPRREVVQAYGQLLARRRSDQNQGDVVSVVTFCSSPHVAAAVTPIDAAPPSLPYSGGGTCYAPALAECQRLLEAAPARYTPALIFMSDGEDCSSGATQAVQQLCSRLRMRNLQVHTIAFGSGIQLLEDMAAAAGSAGQYHAAAGGLQLQQVFVQIAAECSAVDGLVREFAQKLTEMISVKIMVDYL